MDLTKHYLISGRVQGVGFRAFTQRRAVELKLQGWVRNLPDGRVEAVARGGPETLSAFESHLRAGPDHGRVESVRCEEWNSAGLPAGFEVRKDGPQP